ncbi:MAG TPA: class I SAM-dependent methyltransferase, partial [Pseudomonadales bacterium]|nr:class I SAM-dependent methyltransferase [Pseudomonadales bacterium]
MNPISKTAYLCCGTRALDASSKRPLCNDIYAKAFMSPEGARVFERFKQFKRPNISNAVRSRIVEDALRARISGNPDLQIINIGAGFDSRAFRLSGGHWIEIDEPQIIELKNKTLPVERCGNPLCRFAVEFKGDQLERLLRTFDASKETVFVIEGVFMYLEK